MGLQKDIENAYLKSMGFPDEKGNIPELAGDIASAVVDFLKKQTFTITKLKAILEVEEFRTTAPTTANILPKVTYISPSGAPLPVVGGNKGVLVPPIKAKKTGGEGGTLISRGHAYIGPNPVGKTDESLTKVKLLEENIVGK